MKVGNTCEHNEDVVQRAPAIHAVLRIIAHYFSMQNTRTIARIVSLFAIVFVTTPQFISAYVEYGAFYTTPAPYSQLYYQPMYAYAATPVLNNYQQYPSSGYGYSHTYPGYYADNYFLPQYQGYSHTYPGFNYAYPQTYNPIPPAPYGQNINRYGQPVPYNYGYPTGDTVPWTGGQLCEFPDYNGRALCGSNPNQWIYDPWTGSWY